MTPAQPFFLFCIYGYFIYSINIGFFYITRIEVLAIFHFFFPHSLTPLFCEGRRDRSRLIVFPSRPSVFAAAFYVSLERGKKWGEIRKQGGKKLAREEKFFRFVYSFFLEKTQVTLWLSL